MILQAGDDAVDSLLMQPLLTGFPPALHNLCMPPAEAALASPSKGNARKSKAPAPEEAEEDQIEATAPEQDHYDAPDAPADMHDTPIGMWTRCASALNDVQHLAHPQSLSHKAFL